MNIPDYQPPFDEGAGVGFARRPSRLRALWVTNIILVAIIMFLECMADGNGDVLGLPGPISLPLAVLLSVASAGISMYLVAFDRRHRLLAAGALSVVIIASLIL